MAILYEKDAVAKPTDWADLISVVESESTPFTSMIQKRTKPQQVLHYWQAKAYPEVSHQGVLDGVDATEFSSLQAEELTGVSQKVWHNVGVSDFSEDAMTQAGVKGSAIKAQVSDGLVSLKRIIEKRCLSDADSARDNGVDQGNETRGIFKWTDTSWSAYDVPSAFRTPAASKHADTLANFTETIFNGLGQSSYKQKKGPVSLDGFVGIELKQKFTDFTTYQTVSGATQVSSRTFNQEASSNQMINTIDRLVLDTGTYDLHVSSFLKTAAATGADAATTHKVGIFADMSMCGLAYTRLPRVVKQEYQGGGHKRIIDAIFMLMIDNPLCMIPINSTS